jgi:hypothetical protein
MKRNSDGSPEAFQILFSLSIDQAALPFKSLPAGSEMKKAF